jgi:hypothetical protein
MASAGIRGESDGIGAVSAEAHGSVLRGAGAEIAAAWCCDGGEDRIEPPRRTGGLCIGGEAGVSSVDQRVSSQNAA